MSSKIQWGNIILRVPIKLEYETPTGLIKEGPAITAKANLSTRNKKKSITIIADDDIKTPSVSVLKNELKGKRKDNDEITKIRDRLKNDIKKLKDDKLINKDEFKDLNDSLKSGLDLYKKNNDDAELKVLKSKIDYTRGITYVFKGRIDKQDYRRDSIINQLSKKYDEYKSNISVKPEEDKVVEEKIIKPIEKKAVKPIEKKVVKPIEKKVVKPIEKKAVKPIEESKNNDDVLYNQYKARLDILRKENYISQSGYNDRLEDLKDAIDIMPFDNRYIKDIERFINIKEQELKAFQNITPIKPEIEPNKKEKSKVEQPKKETKVEQPKKEEVKEDKNNEILKKLQDDREIFYTNINRFLQSPSKRNSDYLIKELSKINLVTDKYDLIRKLFEANKGFDFVPTPKEFLKDFLEYAKDEENNILEPTCGLGHVIHEILKVNPKAKIIAYEFNKDFYDILLFLYPKNMYPNITFYNKDFLKYAKNENFGLVFCNPPFTINNDKKYFYNFLIKCQELISQSKVNKFEILLFFISPPLYDSLKNAGDIVDWSKFISSISKNKIEDILDKKISNNEYKYIKDYYKDDDDTKDRDIATFLLEDIEPGQMTVLDNVKFKVGASISALLYVSINVVNKKGGKLRRLQRI
jgi:hypothetical protein